MPRHGNARSLRAGLGAEQRQEPRRASVTFVRTALAQNHASGRHEPRPGRKLFRQPRAARPVSPAVQDHGSLLVLKAKRSVSTHTTVPKKRTSVRPWRVDVPSRSTPWRPGKEKGRHVAARARRSRQPGGAGRGRAGQGARRRACRLSAGIPGTPRAGALAQGASADVAEDPLAAGLHERVELQREVLLAGGDARA